MTKEENKGFDGLGINERILKTLYKLGIETPTPIQTKAIPVAIAGKDLFGVAQTGTGKTYAFGVPLIQRLIETKGKALIMLPTRELTNQVEESIRILGRNFGLRTVSIIGGEAYNKQFFLLRKNPHVIVATPGRLLDHVKRGTIKLNDVSILVLDEADMMFDLGFAPQIEEIIKLTPISRQTLLFSATMPAPIIKLAEKYLKSPLQIEIAPAGTTADLVDQEIYMLRREDKMKTLEETLESYKDLVLIFVRTKHGATNLTERLIEKGHRVTEIHSNLSY
ncbi:MAG: DEAD/DEAH box helicase, partial [Patescibacteria group bacterium]